MVAISMWYSVQWLGEAKSQGVGLSGDRMRAEAGIAAACYAERDPAVALVDFLGLRRKVKGGDKLRLMGRHAVAQLGNDARSL